MLLLLLTGPVPALQGALLTTVSSAFTKDGTLRKRAKIDSSDGSYAGRSYSEGSSLSLTILVPRLALYNEMGHAVAVDCSFSGNMAYSIELSGNVDGFTTGLLYEAGDALLNN